MFASWKADSLEKRERRSGLEGEWQLKEAAKKGPAAREEIEHQKERNRLSFVVR